VGACTKRREERAKPARTVDGSRSVRFDFWVRRASNGQTFRLYWVLGFYFSSRNFLFYFALILEVAQRSSQWRIAHFAHSAQLQLQQHATTTAQQQEQQQLETTTTKTTLRATSRGVGCEPRVAASVKSRGLPWASCCPLVSCCVCCGFELWVTTPSSLSCHHVFSALGSSRARGSPGSRALGTGTQPR
jgi:hypothetical protein